MTTSQNYKRYSVNVRKFQQRYKKQFRREARRINLPDGQETILLNLQKRHWAVYDEIHQLVPEKQERNWRWWVKTTKLTVPYDPNFEYNSFSSLLNETFERSMRDALATWFTEHRFRPANKLNT